MFILIRFNAAGIKNADLHIPRCAKIAANTIGVCADALLFEQILVGQNTTVNTIAVYGEMTDPADEKESPLVREDRNETLTSEFLSVFESELLKLRPQFPIIASYSPQLPGKVILLENDSDKN